MAKTNKPPWWPNLTKQWSWDWQKIPVCLSSPFSPLCLSIIPVCVHVGVYLFASFGAIGGFRPGSCLLDFVHLLMITHHYLIPHWSHYLRAWLSFNLRCIVKLLTVSVTQAPMLVVFVLNLCGNLSMEQWAKCAWECFCGETSKDNREHFGSRIVTTVDFVLDNCCNFHK